MTEFYTQPTAMEPLTPTKNRAQLRELSVDLIRETSRLSGLLHPITRDAVRPLLRLMNSYYSNLIEGHSTHPIDIERAISRDYSTQPKKKALQIESAAHIEVQQLLEKRLHAEPDFDLCSATSLQWIHSEFYSRLPNEFHTVSDPDTGKVQQIVSGQLRTSEVKVGRHLPPAAKALPEFIARFNRVYSSPMDGVDRIVATAASHHRLAWIHPFLDGNGRVLRLFSHACLIRAKCDGDGLWTLSRGLSFKKEQYYEMLESADSPRRGDIDGRGNLSDDCLSLFCQFFIETCLDQVHFMGSLLELGKLEQRIMGFASLRAHQGTLRLETGFLLREALLRGEIPRGEAARITGLPERIARDVLAEATRLGLLTSESPKGPVRLAFPVWFCPSIFPKLFPEAIELDIWTSGQPK